MVRISILYPQRATARFDLRYYVKTHMPLSIERLSVHPGFKGVSVEGGVSSAAPDSDPPYVALCQYLFDSLDAFLEAYLPHAELLQADMSNYTDVEPVIQVSEVLILERPAPQPSIL
jgi:uncharacterized protein (TIGR02118 family)